MTHLRPLFTWRSAIVESNLPPTARHVALTLALHMNERGGSCFPSHATLSSETGLNISTVRKQLAVLMEGGWLQRHTVRRGVGRGTRVEYTATTAPLTTSGQSSSGLDDDHCARGATTTALQEGGGSSSVSTSREEAATHFEILIALRADGRISSSIAQIAEMAEGLRQLGVPAEPGAVAEAVLA